MRFSKHFAGKVVVVTGAASGIGKCLVNQFLKAGAVVWGIDIGAKNLEALTLDTRKYGLDFNPLVADISDANAVREAISNILTHHPIIDIWINNAGVSGLGDFLTTPLETIERA